MLAGGTDYREEEVPLRLLMREDVLRVERPRIREPPRYPPVVGAEVEDDALGVPIDPGRGDDPDLIRLLLLLLAGGLLVVPHQAAQDAAELLAGHRQRRGVRHLQESLLDPLEDLALPLAHELRVEPGEFVEQGLDAPADGALRAGKQPPAEGLDETDRPPPVADRLLGHRRGRQCESAGNRLRSWRNRASPSSQSARVRHRLEDLSPHRRELVRGCLHVRRASRRRGSSRNARDPGPAPVGPDVVEGRANRPSGVRSRNRGWIERATCWPAASTSLLQFRLLLEERLELVGGCG